MRRMVLVALVTAVSGILLSCSKAENKAVARVGKDVITVKMIKDQYLAISPSARPDLKTIDEKQSFAKDIASKEILMLEARKLGLDQLPEVTQAGQNAATSRAWQAYFQDEVKSQVKVTDQELQDFYATQKTSYHFGWILMRSKTLADELEGKLKNGEDFAKLAAMYSIDPSRSEGGDFGTRTLGTLPPPVEAKLPTMSAGEISGVIPFDAYYAIVKLYEKQDNTPSTFEQARAGLEAIMRSARENARQREVAAGLRKAYELTFNDATVEMIVFKTSALYASGNTPPGKIPDFSDEELDRELAKWKGGTWKVRNYAENLKSLRDYMVPGYGTDKEAVESLIADYITGELWRAEIKSKGYESRPEAAEAARRAMEEAVVTALHDQLVKDVKVNDAQIASFYEERKADMVTQPGMRLAAIITKDEAGAKAAYEQLKAGAKFETVAKEKSEDKDTAPKGGELQRPLYKSEIERFPDLQGVLDNLQVGAYSTPMPVPAGFGTGGYMIVKLLERMEPRQLGLEEVKQFISPQVLQLEQDKVFADWLKSKTDEYKVEIYPTGLNAIDFTLLKTQGT